MAKSKYEPLKAFLSNSRRADIPMTFDEIEEIIGCKLPLKSSRHPAWWSNNPSNNPMTRAWLEAGYKSESVDTRNRKLIFRQVAKGTQEIELWVGGRQYRKDYGHDGPVLVTFTGRFLAGNWDYRDDDGHEIWVDPIVSVYQTRTGKLIVYRDWREQSKEGVFVDPDGAKASVSLPSRKLRGDDEGATYRTFQDLDSLAASSGALGTSWAETTYYRAGVGDRPDLKQRLLHQVAAALGEPLVIRID